MLCEIETALAGIGLVSVSLLADLETMGAAPERRRCSADLETARWRLAGVGRRGRGGARGMGRGVLALCAALELLHEHPPLVHAVVVRNPQTPW